MYHRTESQEREHEAMDEFGDVVVREEWPAPRRSDGRALGIGLLLGAALGAGAALLLAPASGEDTRRQLRRGARRLYARGRDAVADWREDADRSARRLARRGLEQSRDIARDVRERVRG